jgi:opacity protein-like surface antigen
MFCFAFAYPQTKKISLNQISMLDSLLVQLDTVKVRAYLQNDSLTTPDYILSTSCDWDSLKTHYANLLNQINSESLQGDSVKMLSPESIQSISTRFQNKYVGKYAEQAFANVRTMQEAGKSKKAYQFYIIANFLRRNYMNVEKTRVLRNADQTEATLIDTKALVSSLAAERKQEQHVLLKRRLSEIQEAIERYNQEDKTLPFFQTVAPAEVAYPNTITIAQWLDRRYKNSEAELYRQKGILEQEENEAHFKTIYCSIGIGVGGVIALKEFSPLYILQTANYYNNWTAGRYDLTKESKEVLGYAISSNFMYYIKNDLSLEACFSYSSTKRENWTYVYGWSKFNFESISPIQYYSFSLIGNYILRIKTGMRPFVGAGINYFTTRQSQSNAFNYRNGYDIYQIFSSPVSTESLRLIVRLGVEYLPNEKSHLSYRVVVDALCSIIAPQTENPMVFLPSIGVSWLF